MEIGITHLLNQDRVEMFVDEQLATNVDYAVTLYVKRPVHNITEWMSRITIGANIDLEIWKVAIAKGAYG
jgi:hypothetical protein